MTDERAPALTIEAVDVYLARRCVASVAGFRVAAGEVRALVGGVDASAFVGALAGSVAGAGAGAKLVGGSVLLGATVHRPGSRSAAKVAGIGFVSSGSGISPYQSVGENVLLGVERPARSLLQMFGGLLRSGRGVESRVPDAVRVRSALDLVGLELDAAAPATALDRLGRRLVELARAVLGSPTVVLVDDVGLALSDAESRRWHSALVAVARSGPAIVVATGTVTGLAAYADRATVLGADGPEIDLRDVGDGRDLDANEASAEAAVLERLAARADQLARTARPDAWGAGATTSSVARGIASSVFSVRGWRVHHPADESLTVVDGLSFDCAPGEVLGLFGPLDGGAMEAATSFFGASYGSAVTGTVLIDGDPVDVSTMDRARAAGLVFTTEHPIRFDLSFIGGVPSSVSSESLIRMIAMGVADRHRAYPATTVPTGLVSVIPGAHQGPSAAQFTDTLRSMLDGPMRVVVLGEPLGGGLATGAGVAGDIGEAERAARLDAIASLAAGGQAVVVASADPAVLAACSDRVLAVRAGRVVGTTHDQPTAPDARPTPGDIVRAMGGCA
ncbi:hypothetical protein [Plantibacter sp. YIM 135249]|uniref:hypothetical protein n=1 Tax=Plantibacter sp. YIM 135249 TaxID=3423918 RepID=UPI003D342A24